jgi:GNAT superfamily N-acetyltransferase
MSTNRPPRTQENTLITWRDDLDEPYTKDHSVLRRYYTATQRETGHGLGYITALITKESPVVEVEDFEVWERERSLGTGKMILRAAVAHLKEQGFSEAYGKEIGTAALYAQRAILGEAALKMTHQGTPVDFEQALEYAKATDQAHENIERRLPYKDGYRTIDFKLDIQSVDTQGWVSPTPYDEYTASIPDLERH